MYVAAWLPGNGATSVRTTKWRPPSTERATQRPCASTPATYTTPRPEATTVTSCGYTSLPATANGFAHVRAPSLLELTTVVW